MTKTQTAKTVDSVQSLSRFDNPEEWLGSNFTTPPWPEDKIQDFQKRLDSAFGGENAIVLVWSGDRRYGDEMLNEKGVLEQRPPLVFGEFKVGEDGYFYLTCPRWLLMEVIHGSQLVDGWEESSWANDQHGMPVRIRPENPPEFFYNHLRVIADHEEEVEGIPMCCHRMWANGKRACYGKYREPSDKDIEFVGRIAENMAKKGVTQRNDTPRDAKVLLDAQLGAKHFREAATVRSAARVKDFMMENSRSFFQDILDRKGSTMSASERDALVEQALEEQDEERFSAL